MRTGLVILLTLPLAGCVSAHKPLTAETNAVLASGLAALAVNPLHPLSIANDDGVLFHITEIQGPNGREKFALAPVEGFFRLQPGPNTLTVQPLSYDHRSPETDFDASATLHLLAVPGVAYSLDAFHDGTHLVLSISERNTLRKVVDEVRLAVVRPAPAPPQTIDVDWVVVPGPTPLIIPLPSR